LDIVQLPQKQHKEDRGMKRHTTAPVIAVLCLCLFCSYQTVNGQARRKAKASPTAGETADPIITVLNPLGTPPPLVLKAMAPRLNTIEGKRIYIVDDGYPGSDNLLLELEKGLKEAYPKTNFHYVKKNTFMSAKDDALWAEMQEKADAMVIALGH
jgi:hypothetical protein